MRVKIKVILYVFRNSKTEVLVFAHRDFPEAGLQVVGGTVEADEELKPAMVREVFEEAGLVIQENDLVKIGETDYHRKDKPEINHRHYFKMESESLPEKWTHVVESDGEDNGLLFDFFWLTLQEAKEQLTGNFGELLS